MENTLTYLKNNYYFCLICWDDIQTIPDQSSPESNGKLYQLFEVLKAYMQWDSVGDTFEFNTELFPFCQSCTLLLSKLSEVNDEVQVLLEKIRLLTLNVSTRILLSEGKKKSLELEESSEEEDDDELITTYRFNLKKVSSYRDVTVQRFTPSVTLSRLRQNFKQKSIGCQTDFLVSSRIAKRIEEPVDETNSDLNNPPSTYKELHERENPADLNNPPSTSKELHERGNLVIRPEPEAVLENEQPITLELEEERFQELVCTDAQKSPPVVLVDDSPGFFWHKENISRPESVAAEIDSDSCPSELGSYEGNKDDLERDANAENPEDVPIPVQTENQASEANVEKRDESETQKCLQQQPYRRFVQTSPNKFIYNGKYMFQKLPEGFFQCFECKKLLPSQYVATKHGYDHWCKDLERYKCGECGRAFNRKSSLDRHVRSHRKEKPFKCDKCGEGFVAEKMLPLHMKKFHSEGNETNTSEKPKSYKCGECGKAFNHKSSLDRHVRSHGKEKPFKCDKCGEGFVAEKMLPLHMKRFHSEGNENPTSEKQESSRKEKQHNDPDCTGPAAGDNSLGSVGGTPADSDGAVAGPSGARNTAQANGSNLERARRVGKRKQGEERQNLRFTKPSPDVFLYADVYEVRKLSEDQYRCSKCSVIVKTLSSAARHAYTHYCVDTEKYKCEDCSRLFTRQSSLNHHLWTSHKKRPTETFNRNQKDQRHYRLVERSPNLFVYAGKYKFQKLSEIQYQCVQCTISFSSRNAVMRHGRFHYSKDANKYKCPTCGKAFGRKDVLDLHLLAHSNQKPYSCRSCGKGFTRKLGMQFHFDNQLCLRPSIVEDSNHGNTWALQDSDVNRGESIAQVGVNDPEKNPEVESGEETETDTENREQGCIQGSSIKNAQEKTISLVPVSRGIFVYRGKYRVRQVSENGYECLECSRNFPTHEAVCKHVYFHYFQDSRREKNKVLGKVFGRKSDFSHRHSSSPHPTKKSFPCEFCKATYASSYSLSAHNRKHHSEQIGVPFEPKPKNVICGYCGKGFDSKHKLNRHHKVHGIIFKPVTCEICDTVMSKYEIKRHMFSHYPPQHPCPDCKKSFSTPGTLKKHQKIHNIKPFSCSFCRKRFAHKFAVLHHKHSHHKEGTAAKLPKKRKKRGTGTHPCDLCGKRFHKKDSIPYHKKRYHSDLTPELDRRLRETRSRKRSTVLKLKSYS